MTLAVKDRVRETSATAGTGTLTLAGAVSGFQAFSVIGDANTTYYGIVDSTTGAFEVGIGTYTLSGTTLSRTTVLSSSNAGSLVNFAANTKDVFVTYPSSKSVYYDASSNLPITGSVGIGATPATGYNLIISKTLTGATSTYGVYNDSQIQSDVTSGASYFRSQSSTAAAAFTNSFLTHYETGQGTFGVGSTVTNQYGFNVASSLTGATNNYGFFGNIAAGTNRFNFYAGGTANNYMAGSLGIGTTSLGSYNLRMVKNVTGATTSYGIANELTVQSDVTTAAFVYRSSVSTQAAAFTLGSLYHISIEQGTIGATSAVTNQYGVLVNSSLTGATNNYGFFGNIAAGTGRFNFYAGGTANNYMAGRLGIGTTTLTEVNFAIDKNVTGATTAYGMYSLGAIQSDVTSEARYYTTFATTQATVFTLASLKHYDAVQGTLGAGSVVTNQYGFSAESSLTGATNNYGFFSNIASGTGRFNFYAAGTAANFFGGRVVVQTADALAFSVGLTGSTNPAFTVDSSTALQVAGFKVTGAVTGGTVALVATDSGSNTSLTLNAKGTGTIGIGSVSTGIVTITPATTFVGLVTVPAGTAALPAIRSTLGTSNTGVFFPADDTIAWSTNGIEKLRISATGGVSVTSAIATAFAVGLTGATNPAFTVDSSTALQVAGFKVTGAVTGGTVALVATDSGSNTSLTLNAKGTGTISIGSVSSGNIIFGGTVSATRRVEFDTSGTGTFAQGNNALTTNIVLQNLDTSSTTNHGSSMLWKTCTNAVATAIDSGRIAVLKEQLWTSTASTQDSAMTFATTLDGTLTERMRIDSSGLVGIGTTTPSSFNSFAYNLVVGSGSGEEGITIYTGTASYGSIHFADGTAGADAYRGVVRYQHSDNHMEFLTDGAERMRINSSGQVMVNTTSASGNFTSTSTGTSSSPIAAVSPASFTTANYYSNSLTAASAAWYHFYATSSNNTVQDCIIYGNGDIQNTNNAYGAISDIKLKENITDATPKLEQLNRVRVVNFNIKSSPEQKQIGVIAQELENIFPGMVTEVNDRDADGSALETKTKSVKYSVFVPMLIKAMQEQQAMIETLTARITALENT